jgi:hypothetical protein
MERQVRVNLADKSLEPVYQFAMPSQKSGPPMHVSRLMDFILLEPKRYSAYRIVTSLSAVGFVL